jgi:glutaredoxin
MKAKLAALALAAATVIANFSVPLTRADAATQHEVYVFDTSWCPYCHQLEAMLQQNHIKYTSFDIEKLPQARAYMQQHYHTTAVPVIVIDGRHVLGFNEKLIRQLLSIS